MIKATMFSSEDGFIKSATIEDNPVNRDVTRGISMNLRRNYYPNRLLQG